MQHLTDSINKAGTATGFSYSSLLYGGQLIGNDSASVSLRYSGLGDAFSEYNFVDGLWMGQTLNFNFRKKRHSALRFNPSAYWASARKKLLWETELIVDYAPKRLGQARLSAGSTTADFSGPAGMDRLLNSLYSSLGGRNFARFYHKQYLRIENQIDVANGLQLTLGYETATRQSLENRTTWNLFRVQDRWSANVPDYHQPLYLEEYKRLAQYSLRLAYTPEYYYRLKNGVKTYHHSRFPTFEADYCRGLNSAHSSVFSRLELSIRQQIPVGVFSRLNYSLTAGKYFDANPFNYIDYKHFPSGGPWLSLKDWRTSYALLPYYAHSTNRQWLQAFINYDTDYLLLKRLPYLQGKLFSEVIQAKFLHTPDKRHYSEWGYSIHLPGNIGGVGVFASFDLFDYQAWGVQFSLPLLQTSGRQGKQYSVSISY
jgi:hypothetical protein